MPFPPDIQAFLDAHRPCCEGIERLAEHASMQAAWDASTHGPFLAYIVKKEGLETPAVKAVNATHRVAVKAAFKLAMTAEPQGTARLQDIDANYAAKLAAHAAALKAIVPNPFAP
jgi:hypothetical protein